ncbi:MAG: type II toxin-antitoxin system Phd/YefM family antitoxin [Candidatus Gracilibacteria bacterium]|jgi:prevent-host-death family protein
MPNTYSEDLVTLPDVRYNVHMNGKVTLPISEARKNIFRIADEAQKYGNYYTLTEKGKPKIILMSAEEFESWQETLEVMGDPEILNAIKETEADVESGAYKNYMTLEALLSEEGFFPIDKKNVNNAIPNNSKTSGRKRAKKTR